MGNDPRTNGKRLLSGTFCGVQLLSKRLSALESQSDNMAINKEIRAVVSELALLDAGLDRLRHERHFVDEQDIDHFLDRLRGGRQGGA